MDLALLTVQEHIGFSRLWALAASTIVAGCENEGQSVMQRIGLRELNIGDVKVRGETEKKVGRGLLLKRVTSLGEGRKG